MSKSSAELVRLLHELFRQEDLSRALEFADWSAELVRHLSPAEHTSADAWFHEVVRLVVQRGEVTELLDELRRLRPMQATKIDAVARLFLTEGSSAASAPRAPSPDLTPAKETRPARSAWSPVRVLHLSDLHFSATTAWDAGAVLDRLLIDIRRLRKDVGEIDLVVVTGDIADRGVAEEYSLATTWLTGPLADEAGVTTAQIRVVPGNHDVNRGSIGPSARLVAEGLLSHPNPQQAIAEVLGSETERALLLARQSAYLHFAQTFHPGLTAPWWFERHTIRGLNLHLAGFNSAWLSASDQDRGRLFLSRWQCNKLLAKAEADDVDLSIALLHHPWDYLKELDRASEEEIRRRCGVILHGHLHDQKARLTSDPDRDVLQLAAGSSYAGAEWDNAYQLVELDPIHGEARVHLRLWKGHDWIPDRNCYQKAPDAVATLPLRRSPRAPKPPPNEDL